MKKNTYLLPLLLCFIAGFSNAQNSAPTWSDAVACIVYTHCTDCHNPNGIGPFSMLTNEDAAPHASSIVSAVESKTMPPWHADPTFRTFAHENRLTDAEIATIKQWANNGTPKGNIANAPEVPTYTNPYTTATAEFVAKIPTYEIKASKDVYRCFVIPSGLTADRFIKNFSVLPGNRAIVHHVLVYQDTSSKVLKLDAADPDLGYTSFGGVGSSSAKLIGGWVPGSQPYQIPAGMGVKVNAKSNIVIQIHYPAGVAGQSDSTKVLINYATETNLRPVGILPILNHQTTMMDGPLKIPANTVKTFHQQYTIPLQVTILSVAPHMHLIGRSMKVWGVTAAGDTIPLINIPDWDFHWQGQYVFKKPIVLPPLTTVYAEATYDNTSNNPENPNNPPKQVNVGESTTDEMMLTYFTVLLYQNGDENIVTPENTSNYKNCKSVVSSNELLTDLAWEIAPNPVHEVLSIQTDLLDKNAVLTLTDLNGRVLMQQNVPTGTAMLQMNVGHLANGLYLATLQTETGKAAKKVVISF